MRVAAAAAPGPDEPPEQPGATTPKASVIATMAVNRPRAFERSGRPILTGRLYTAADHNAITRPGLLGSLPQEL
jgi:hypothetical protein